ncbi:hypothetical protein [Frigoribacterium faeni]|uniref:hypothetical protein n=1 Tax=Frigoribacterium faeni TaxID=145483 RepID=UPI00141BE7C0|nr:hypothetical protein [Frigoribacterium faeni]NIJ05668.1 hypothetical protein [Frigoribacterium faeni]
MAETTHHRRPAAARTVRTALVAVAATLLLGACAQTAPGSAPDAGAAPTGSATSSSPPVEGDGAGDDAPADDLGPSVAWVDEGRTFSLTLYGSSSCPPAVDAVEAAGTDAVTVRLAPVDPGPCTFDYVPTASEHELPAGVDGRPVSVEVVSAAEGVEPVSLELP